jgi:hypothetical protein
MRRERTRRFIAGFAGLSSLVLVTLLAPVAARAGVDGDVRAAVRTDADQVSVAGGLLTQVGSGSRWYFNPNLEVATGDRENIVAMNGDFHYDLNQGSGPAFWVGAGPALMVVDPEGRDSQTDLGLNVLTGIGKKRGDVRPFAQLCGTVADDSRVTLAGGIRF